MDFLFQERALAAGVVKQRVQKPKSPIDIKSNEVSWFLTNILSSNYVLIIYDNKAGGVVVLGIYRVRMVMSRELEIWVYMIYTCLIYRSPARITSQLKNLFV